MRMVVRLETSFRDGIGMGAGWVGKMCRGQVSWASYIFRDRFVLLPLHIITYHNIS